jgi:hypothetical protein
MADRQPHFRIPFRFDGFGVLLTNEQGTLDEIATNVEIIIRYERGSFEPLPTFGITYPEFSEKINIEKMKSEILEWEPRADLIFTEKPDLIDTHIQRINIATGTGGRND